jgi:L-lactate dehydrogenase complex protein LldE
MARQSVQLFATCIVETLTPEIGLAAAQVLERLGVTVVVPGGLTCCGQPAFNGGFWDDARAMARHTLDVLGQSDAPVVIPSGSCADMIQRHYPELFAADPVYGPRAEELAGRVYEFSEFLVDKLGQIDMQARFPARLTYHASCHTLRGKGVTHQPLDLLSRVRDAQLVELPGATECCGFGGLFAVKMGDISGSMLSRKLDNIEQTGADAVVGCDPSCLLHMAGGLHRRGSHIRALHIAQVLKGVGPDDPQGSPGEGPSALPGWREKP